MRLHIAAFMSMVLTIHVLPVSAEPVVIEGVPRLGWGIGRACPHIAALHAALTPMGCPVRYEEMVVASGAAFTIAWCPGRYGYMAMAAAPEDIVVNGASAVGATAERVGFDSEEEAWAAVCESIDRGAPVIAWQGQGAQVICGYDPAGRRMYVEEYYDKSGVYQVVDFETPDVPYPIDHPNEIVLLQYNREQPLPELDWPAVLSRAVRFADWPVHQKLHKIYVFGLPAYDAWAQTLRSGLGPRETSEEAAGVTLAMAGMLADARAAASVVLAENATIHDAFGDAAHHYMAEAEILKQVRPALSRNHPGPWAEERQAMFDSFPDQDVREAAARLVEEARQKEIMAVDALRVALADLGETPAPAGPVAAEPTAATPRRAEPEPTVTAVPHDGVDPAAREKADQHCQRGRQLKAQGKFAEAAEELKKAIRSDPRHVEAHWVLGWVLIELKDTESARTELRKVIELAPESDKAREAQKALERIAP